MWQVFVFTPSLVSETQLVRAKLSWKSAGFVFPQSGPWKASNKVTTQIDQDQGLQGFKVSRTRACCNSREMYEKVWILNIEVAPIHFCKLVWYDCSWGCCKRHTVFFPLLTVANAAYDCCSYKIQLWLYFKTGNLPSSRSLLSQCPFKEVQRQKRTPLLVSQLWVI